MIIPHEAIDVVCRQFLASDNTPGNGALGAPFKRSLGGEFRSSSGKEVNCPTLPKSGRMGHPPALSQRPYCLCFFRYQGPNRRDRVFLI